PTRFSRARRGKGNALKRPRSPLLPLILSPPIHTRFSFRSPIPVPPPMDKLHVGLIYGGHSSEHEVSITSARNVYAALDPAKYRVTPIRIDRAGRWHVEDFETSVLNGAEEGPASDRETLFAPAAEGG